MLKKTMTYTDYNGVERTEDFYFSLSKAEIMEMELSTSGGLSSMIEGIVAAKDTASIVKIFKEMILKSVGKKSPDGRKFVKNKEIAEDFEQTPAYSDLFMQLATDDKAAAAFVNGIVPADVSEKAAEMNKEDTAKIIDMESVADVPATVESTDTNK